MLFNAIGFIAAQGAAGAGGVTGLVFYPAEIQADQALALYRLSDLASPAADELLNGPNGAISNEENFNAAGLLVLDDDGCIEFDGTSDGNVNFGTTGVALIGDPFTVEFLMETDTLASDKDILNQRSDTSANVAILVQQRSSNNAIRFSSSSGDVFENTNKTLSVDMVHHIAIVRLEDEYLAIYVDGVQAITTSGAAVTENLNPAGHDLVMGLRQEGNTNDYNGKLDEFAIYKLDLSELQVNRHYRVSLAKRPIIRYENIILRDLPEAFWRCSDSVGGNIIDETANAYDLTTVGSSVGQEQRRLHEQGFHSLSGAGDDNSGASASVVPLADDLNNFTLECWIFKTANPGAGDNYALMLQSESGATDTDVNYYVYIDDTGDVNFDKFTPVGGVLTSTNSVPNGEAVHIVVTEDGADRAIYINGELDNSDSSSETYDGGASTIMRLGDNPRSGAQNGLNGFMQDAAMYSYTLDAGRINFHYWMGAGQSDYALAVIEKDPQLYLRLNETTLSDGSSIQDYSKNRHAADVDDVGTGTLASGAAIGVLFDHQHDSVNFDELQAHIEVPDDTTLDFAGDLSIVAFINKDDNGASNVGRILSKFTASTGYELHLNTDGDLVLEIDSTTVTSGLALSNDTDYFIAVVLDTVADTVAWYVNGILQETSTTITAIPTANAAIMYVGSDASDNTFDGELSELAVYDRVLTSFEVMDLYARGLGEDDYWASVMHDDPEAYWRLQEGSGTLVSEVGSNDLGTVNGDPTYNEASQLNSNEFQDRSIEYDGVGDSHDGTVTPGGVGDVDTYSLEIWANPNSISGDAGLLVQAPSTATSETNMGIFRIGSTLRLGKNPSTVDQPLDAASQFVVDELIHILCVESSSARAIYVNGREVAGDALREDYTGGTINRTSIGGSLDGLDFNGHLDEAAIYTQTLTQADAARHYYTGIGASYIVECIKDGAVGLWPLDEASGTTAGELIGNEITNIENVPTFGETAIVKNLPSAISLNGTNEAFDIPGGESLFDINVGAYEFWIRPSADGSGLSSGAEHTFFYTGTSASGQKHMVGLFNVGGTLQWLAGPFISGGADARVQVLESNVSYDADTTYHLAINYDNDSELTELWINGVLVGTDTTTRGTITPTDSLKFGANTGEAEYFPGIMQGVAVYDKLLTPNQIRKHYALGKV